MKAYLFDSINRYKRFSENLDVQATLCNKTWLVFNDSGEKEVYIFQDNGSLRIILNGSVTNASWEYISANKSLILGTKTQSYMVHPYFMDNNIFALQIDGTNKFSFLIDECNKINFKPISLNELHQYFNQQEQKFIIQENIRAKEALDKEQAVKLKRLAKCERENKEYIGQILWEKDKEQILAKNITYKVLSNPGFYILIILLGLLLAVIFLLILSSYGKSSYIYIENEIPFSWLVDLLWYLVLIVEALILVVLSIGPYALILRKVWSIEDFESKKYINEFMEFNRFLNLDDVELKYRSILNDVNYKRK